MYKPIYKMMYKKWSKKSRQSDRKIVIHSSSDGDGIDQSAHQNAHQNNGELVAEKSKVNMRRPSLYRVLLLNDDYTPCEFVIMLLMQFFSMNQEAAELIMIKVHTKGVGVCGVFPKEIAETKVRLVLDCANENQHPLQCTLEKE